MSERPAPRPHPAPRGGARARAGASVPGTGVGGPRAGRPLPSAPRRVRRPARGPPPPPSFRPAETPLFRGAAPAGRGLWRERASAPPVCGAGRTAASQPAFPPRTWPGFSAQTCAGRWDPAPAAARPPRVGRTRDPSPKGPEDSSEAPAQLQPTLLLPPRPHSPKEPSQRPRPQPALHFPLGMLFLRHH